jgi:acetyl esterase/lipase
MRKLISLVLIALATLLPACSIVTMPVPVSAPTPPPAHPLPTRTPAVIPFDHTKFGTVERNITYCTSDGIALTLDMHYPKAMSRPAPILVYVHGGSWSSGDKNDWHGMIDVPELLSRGYLVASVDYRHAPKWKFPTQLEDVKCAIRFLRANAARFSLDANRIGAWGHSAGGHLVSMLGTTDIGAGFEGDGGYPDQSSRVQAVVDLCGRADLIGMPVDMAVSVFGVTDNSVHLLEHASPVTFVTQDDPPFLILHGDKDTVVPPAVSQELYDKLRAAGVPAKLVMVKNADHDFSPMDGAMSPSREEITKMIADFFDEHLRQP